MSIAPFARCLRAETMEVGTMVASEVPTASFIWTASGMPKSGKTLNSTGTMTMPPPTPSSPARVPETRPVAAIASARPASQRGSCIDAP